MVFGWLFSWDVIGAICFIGCVIWFVGTISRTAKATERAARTLDEIKDLLERDHD
jgi:hypothetical protein